MQLKLGSPDISATLTIKCPQQWCGSIVCSIHAGMDWTMRHTRPHLHRCNAWECCKSGGCS